jgi:anti-sigma regulatory factor (Ser/Thr protein kinase)
VCVVSDGVGLEVQLPRTPDVACAARRALRAWCADRIGDDELGDAELLLSEVATNALVHGHGEISLRARLDGDSLRVSVSDQGRGFVCDVHPGDGSHLGGWGLGIVDRTACRWGLRDGGAQVWFELALRAAPNVRGY